ncbi:MAG: hypothetical protein LUE10_07905 [Alistipes sp.]|nr:hypothetical protein [Alistipes sp.]
MNDISSRRLLWILAGIIAFFVVAAIVQWLWNCIIPWVIGFPPVTYWQGAGLLLLTRILFGRIGRLAPRGCGCPCCKNEDNSAKSASNRNLKDMEPLQREEYLLRSRVFLEDAHQK